MQLNWKPWIWPGISYAEGLGGLYLAHRAEGTDGIDTARGVIFPADLRINDHNNPGFIRFLGVDPLDRVKAECQRREDMFDHEHVEGWWMPGRCVHVIGYGVARNHEFHSVPCGLRLNDKTLADYLPGRIHPSG